MNTSQKMLFVFLASMNATSYQMVQTMNQFNQKFNPKNSIFGDFLHTSNVNTSNVKPKLTSKKSFKKVRTIFLVNTFKLLL